MSPEPRDLRLAFSAWCPNCGAFSSGKKPMVRPAENPESAKRDREKEKEDYAYAVLKNMGIDMSCGSCASQAFTGSTVYRHTCTKPFWKTEEQAVTKLLVRTILSHATSFDWSLQGFGMFRLYLSKEQRLHVWDDRFAVPNVSTIHTHPWHFTSYVVSGRMTDVLYEVHPLIPLAVPGSDSYEKQQIVCGPGGGACGPVEHVLLSKLQEVTIEEGQSYSLTADAFHESKPEPGTVTIIDREFREDTEHAYVCFPHGQKWVSAEPRPALVKEVEAMAERALARFR
jgi:hypothetical protein